MKLPKTLITTFCLLFSVVCDAQSPYALHLMTNWKRLSTLDTASLRISYDFIFRDAVFFNPITHPNGLHDSVFRDRTLKDIRIVEIGPSVRKDYSYHLEARELEVKELEEKGAPITRSPNLKIYPLELFLYKDYSRTNYRTMWAGPILQYQEENKSIPWVLLNDTEQIGSYLCQKATVLFGGRKWTAWFCPDIPIDGGPYKFGGLPGLILKVQDAEGHFCWEMTGIEQGEWPIYEKQYLFQKCSVTEARKVIQDIYAHPFMFLKNRDIKITFYSQETRSVREPGEQEYALSMYYDPIELE